MEGNQYGIDSADWSYLTKTERGTEVFVDHVSIKRKGDVASMMVKMRPAKALVIGGKPATYVAQEMHINCATKVLWRDFEASYGDDRRIVRESIDPSQPTAIAPDTLGAQLHSIACKKQPRDSK